MYKSLILLLILSACLFGEEEPPKMGNFALPSSQQPYGIDALGCNILDKGELQTWLYADDYSGKRRRLIELMPYAAYGLREDLSLSLFLPFTPLNKSEDQKSNGPEDFFLQLEYVFYTKSSKTSVQQATLFSSLIFPTGSINKSPSTGLGSYSFLLGGTFSCYRVDWFLFAVPATILSTSKGSTRSGNQFIYQLGIGRNIPGPPDQIRAWMVEINGLYGQKNRIKGVVDNDSGGNVIFLTPSLWFSTKRFIAQFGVSFPVNQNLFGDQQKVDYALNLNVAYSL